MGQRQNKKRGQELDLSDADQVFDLLKECCAESRSVGVLSDGQLREAAFATISRDGLLLNILCDVSVECFSILSLVCVTFSYGERSHVFLASVLDYQSPALLLKLPEQLATSEGRHAFRVPMLANSGLRVNVVASDKRDWNPHPVNLSLGGILIEFSRNNVPELTVGDELNVKLSLNEDAVSLRGVVRQRQGEQRYGILFPDVVRKGQVDPPEPLRKIVNEAERRWLAERVEVAV